MELQRGQKIKIKDITSSDSLELKVDLSLSNGTADITCFGVDSLDKLSDDRYFVFYNQTSTPEQSITMKQDGDFTSFFIQLHKLPPFLKKIVVTVAAEGDVTMQNLASGRLSLSDGQQLLAGYSFNGDSFTREKAVILCELYEKDGVWRIAVVSSGFNGGLSALLAHFGGEEAEPAPSPAPVTPVSPVPPVSSPPPAFDSGIHKCEPPAKNPVPSQPVSLKKKGDSHKISLEKNNKEIHVNLNWNTDYRKKSLFGSGGSSRIDLDLACLYRLKSGKTNIIQALGNSFGAADKEPYILLDHDDRTGASQNGENMWFKKPELIDFAVVFAYIYEGTPNWKNTGASVVLKQQGSQDIQIFIDNAERVNRFCVIASLTGRGSQLEVKREELFFKGHREVDQHYGFGLRWVTSRK